MKAPGNHARCFNLSGPSVPLIVDIIQSQVNCASQAIGSTVEALDEFQPRLRIK
jgi:hypothetical protein